MSAERIPGTEQEPNLRPVEREHSGAEMTLIEHLLELRNRVIVCAIAVIGGILICAIFWQRILGWLLAPARSQYDPEFGLAIFSPTEGITVLFKIALYGGVILASPVILYEVVAFIVPGLTPKERKMLLPGVAGAVAFLLGGMAFAYWVILPASMGFLLDLGGDNFDPVIGAKQYLDFATRIVFFVGIAFELPMVLALLGKLGMVRARQLLGFWRYAVIIVFIIAAIVTPTPDPLTQSLVGVPLLLLYFVGILFVWAVQPKRTEPQGPVAL